MFRPDARLTGESVYGSHPAIGAVYETNGT